MLELFKKDPKTKRKKQKFSSVLKNNLYMIGKVARYTPDYFILMIAEGVIWGLINSAASIFSFRLLNAIDGGTEFAYAASLIGMMALFYILAHGLPLDRSRCIPSDLYLAYSFSSFAFSASSSSLLIRSYLKGNSPFVG